MLHRSYSLLLLLAFGCAHNNVQPASSTADLLLRNGRIYTLDAAVPWAESLAVKDGRIVFVGEDSALADWLGDSTVETIDLEGRMVVPGFVDGHVHPISAGIEMAEAHLGKCETKEEIFETIAAYVKEHPDLEWVLGNTWELPIFPDAHPRKEWLDDLIGDRPAIFSAADGHSAWANSKALEKAGIAKETPDPPNGRIERDENGEPTGTLRESAMDLVYKIAPKPTLEQRTDALARAVAEMHRFGITGFQEASVDRERLEAYRELKKRGGLKMRVSAALYAEPEGDLAEVMAQIGELEKLREEFTDENLEVSTVKIFTDGVIEANTAAMLEPYTDKPDSRGTLNWPTEKLFPFVKTMDERGFKLHFHVIGDHAIRVAFDSLAHLNEHNGERDRRPGLSHIQVFHPSDLERFGELDAVPVFQPLWAYEDTYITDLTLPKLGPERSRWIYPIATVAKNAPVLAFGSDWSVSSPNPIYGIEVAVTRIRARARADSKPVFIPEERIDVATALRAYTYGSAFANYWEKEAGSLEVGKSADLAVLSQNLFDIEPAQISDTTVVMTMFAGEIVYQGK